uniref:Uncharacterized protein n=1 Tax=Solanum tuberosum TaxID=4113 RepID=M1DDJ8_SOLTU
MSNPYFLSRTPLSLEMENPNPFHFLTSLVEISPSTPMCGMGKTGEFVTPQTKVVEQSTFKPVEPLPFSLTLVLSGKYSQNSKVQLVVKPASGVPTEELDVTSQLGPMSSMMSERLFDGDLPKEKGTESNILDVAEELVVPIKVKHVIDQNPKVDAVTNDEDDENISLSWSRKGVRGEHTPDCAIANLACTGISVEAKSLEEPYEFEREKKDEWEGKAGGIYSKEGG